MMRCKEMMGFCLLAFSLFDLAYSEIALGRISRGFRGTSFNWIDDNGAFLSSINRSFTLGVANPSESNDFYLLIMHRPTSTIVWTANRDSPMSSNDVFAFGTDGEATLTSSTKGIVWRSNTKKAGVTAMELQESGNLVFVNSKGGVVWQSFDFPTDTIISGQVFKSGMKLVSRGASQGVSNVNLSSGSYVLQLEKGDARLIAEFQPVQTYWSLQSDSRRIDLEGGLPESAALRSSGWIFYGTRGAPVSQILFSVHPLPNSSMVFATLVSDGSLQFSGFDFATSASSVPIPLSIPSAYCDRPSPCGPYSLCSSAGVCACPQALISMYGSSCSPPPNSSTTHCGSSSSPSSPSFFRVGGGFTYFATKFHPSENVTGLTDCEKLCRNNCSCNVLFFQNKSNSCYTWNQIGSLQTAADEDNSFDLYVKTSGSTITTNNSKANKSGSFWFVYVIGAVSAVGLLIIAFLLFFCNCRKRKEAGGAKSWESSSSSDGGDDIAEMVPGLPTRFTFRELQLATDNFKVVLGRGGFGKVYEGQLPDGRRVAVKQLEKIGQGKKEFQAEVATMGSIHHLHLMRLRGFCAEGKQRLLVYDFMANGSLDKLLFKRSNPMPPAEGAEILGWKKRFAIAVGTAKGLAYLHEECPVRIIHCDVKPENILLDENSVPKVSDFGLAKLLSREESQAFTTLRGTRGYLAPEWLTTSAVSTKSDVYSFGMVLLELVAGRKNFNPSTSSEKCYFPAYAYEKQGEGKVEDLVDERLVLEEGDMEEVARCVRVAMWCVQEDWSLRPPMGMVVKMLSGSIQIPELPPVPPSGFRLHLSMLKGEVSLRSGEEKASATTSTATATTSTTNNISETSESMDQAVLSSYDLSGPR